MHIGVKQEAQINQCAWKRDLKKRHNVQKQKECERNGKAKCMKNWEDIERNL